MLVTVLESKDRRIVHDFRGEISSRNASFHIFADIVERSLCYGPESRDHFD